MYLLFLFVSALLATIIIGASGWGYYTTPLVDRPFHPQYESLKPTGLVGHGLGIVGSLMITVGVVTYSSRKRLRLFSGMGKIKNYLEFHIFLCLLGPILVLYHTTFKFGGLVAVSFWSMIAVVLSGFIGRYFYTQIPKGIAGNELSITELNAANAQLAEQLSTRFQLPKEALQRIDQIALPPKPVAEMSLLEVFRFFIVNDLTRRGKLHALLAQLGKRSIDARMIRKVKSIAVHRIVLTRRIAFLEKFKRVFYYWHVVHLPFSIVMFVILGVHVGVAVAFGYTWIF